jgi:bifunctional non-homologous end joining protein LigD
VTYEASQPFAKSIAEALERDHPDLVISEMAKAKRRGKVFVDWSQNSERKSTVAVYSLRAKRARPFVAFPIAWDELKKAMKKGDPSAFFFEPEECLGRLKKSGDLFAPLLKLKQKLPEPFLALERRGAPPGRAGGGGSLETYREKRDFAKTPEPPPTQKKTDRKKAEGPRLFVIQKHDASHLHYDLRLEMHGVLKSWAVPKGPPYEAGEKRLAMATEDHPMEYARFEGIIPEGQYGGGTVMVWDIGTYEVVDGNYWQGKLHVRFNGKKLKGEWVLVRGGADDGRKQSWLFIKAGESMRPLSARQDNFSALTRRSMAAIAAARDAEWQSNRGNGRKSPAEAATAIDLAELPEKPAAFIEPMQCRAVDKLPEGEGWLYEIKLDGYRCLAVKTGAEVELFSRNRRSFNAAFPAVARALAPLDDGTVLDGEIVALDAKGRPAFNALQRRKAINKNITYYLFDILIDGGRSLLGLPLVKRRQRLEEIAARLDGPLRLSQTFAGTAAELIAAAGKLGLEGLVAKRKDSRYEPGRRSGAWTKYRVDQGQELVIGGYVPGGGGFQSLLAGYYENGRLLFVGKVKNGFVPRVKREVAALFKDLETEGCPFANLPEKKRARRGEALTAEAMRRCRWLKPELIAQVEYTDWTEANHLRHARFVGLREDKDPREVVHETAPASV